MAETQQVHNSSNDEEESPEPEMSRSSRRFKASNMSFVEMVNMVDILKRADYDGKYGPYTNPNERKVKIMTKVVKSLRRNFGVRRSKEQLRKRWSDLKLREQDQYRKIKKVVLKSAPVDTWGVYMCETCPKKVSIPALVRRAKTRKYEDTRDPPEEGEQRMWREERWLKLTPQQVTLSTSLRAECINNVFYVSQPLLTYTIGSPLDSFLLCSIWHPSRISDLIIIIIILISSIIIITTGNNLAIRCGLGNMNANLSTSVPPSL
ncbi:hypothetical protein AB205_0140230 [Aquarana catesbeiana]|uniref:Uncharacterized protein n=1 Tax=Aquarana catesbeiana TaxID=8400 RepID=A0A2G9RDG7_AQUCT|nr:hypothetical protein AB205_0140230 [Aquarana catesbeiana]